MSDNPLVPLIAKRFIQQRDVKAVQMSSGAYVPDRELKQNGQPNPGRHGPLGFDWDSLERHLAGTATYGHYLLDSNDRCRMFGLDIDLETEGSWCELPPWEVTDPNISEADYMEQVGVHTDVNPRELWLDRAALGPRTWYKTQMGLIARDFAKHITDFGLPCAAAYSGSKGVHIYGFTGDKPASAVREAAMTVVMDMADDWEPKKQGSNFFKHRVRDPFMGYPSFSLEIYPKQDSLKDKDLGNLMRLPLGRNLKSPDPCFFLDLTTPAGVMAPHSDPVKLLETGNPWL